MELQTSNLYILGWVVFVALYLFFLTKIATKQKREAEENDEEFNFFTNFKTMRFAIGGILLVALYMFINPTTTDIDNYTDNLDFQSEFETVTEEDRVQNENAVNLDDEARSSRLEELRIQNQVMSEKIEKEYETTTKGENE